jgi:hypothetical protein
MFMLPTENEIYKLKTIVERDIKMSMVPHRRTNLDIK